MSPPPSSPGRCVLILQSNGTRPAQHEVGVVLRETIPTGVGPRAANPGFVTLFMAITTNCFMRSGMACAEEVMRSVLKTNVVSNCTGRSEVVEQKLHPKLSAGQHRNNFKDAHYVIIDTRTRASSLPIAGSLPK